MMFGIDTNILLRFFETSDDPQQTAAVRHFIRDQAPVFIGPVVLAEFVWTLRRQFGFDRERISLYLLRLVEAPEFILSEPDAVERAVDQYQNGPADFADYLLGELNFAAGCQATVTFDRHASKAPTFQLLET